MGKILVVTRNNVKYAAVPDGLKWAIPIHECFTRPEVLAAGRARLARVKQQVKLK